MKISYDKKDDILFIRFNDKAVIKDVSYGWNVTAGMAEDGIAQITVLDAKADGLLPVEAPPELLRRAG